MNERDIGAPSPTQITAKTISGAMWASPPTHSNVGADAHIRPKNGQRNISELARVCDISRTTVYKYIGLLEV